jgi:hypothetical protein
MRRGSGQKLGAVRAGQSRIFRRVARERSRREPHALRNALANLFLLGYIHYMECEVLFTDEFATWWHALGEDEQDSIDRVVRMLSEYGPALRFPYSSGLESSDYPQMRELRIQHAGRPYRVLYAFDPKRRAILLLGGDKTGKDRWYETHIPIADRIYREYLHELEQDNES